MERADRKTNKKESIELKGGEKYITVMKSQL
jgi:hypothetical protein